ncbi:MAG: Retroviral aspartyl protease [Dehalococcoidia bacterium]|nr:Retroviral aspartyl protease [Dehalococcoidia bacterium]
MTVDTGASYSKLPASLLEKLGIEREPQTYPVVLADDRVEEYAIGQASFEIAGRARTSPVLFGEEGIALLGATSLQALGLIPDTQSHQLVDAKLLMVGMRSADNSATGNPL